MAGALIERWKFGHEHKGKRSMWRHRHAWGKDKWRWRLRLEWRSTSQGLEVRPEAQKRPGTLSPRAFREPGSADTWVLDSQPPELWANRILLLSATQFAGLCSSSPRTLIYPGSQWRIWSQGKSSKGQEWCITFSKDPLGCRMNMTEPRGSEIGVSYRT